MDDVVLRYVDVLARLEEFCSQQDPKTRQPRRPLADPQWESLRQAFFGSAGIVALPADAGRFVLDRVERQKFVKLGNAVKQLETKSAGKAGRAMVMRDAPRPVEPRVFIRGNPGRPGKIVPRRFLKVLARPERRPFAKGSGRLELAQAIVDPRNPLTARVLVNRVWQWHFGQALVTTPSDFGLRSDPPSHPELLDELAASFVDGGWSIKTLHRKIMLSSVYQERSDPRPDCLMRDPRNQLLWRFNRQRLDFESMRDSVLAAAETLDTTQGGPSVALDEPPFPHRRTVYGFIDRQNLDGVYRTFDFAVPDATNPKRFVTTVPQQALFLMNSPFIQEQAKRLASAAENDRHSQNPQQTSPSSEADEAENVVRWLYRRALGRSPSDHELTLGAAFLRKQGLSSDSLSSLTQLAQVLMLTNEFMFVD